MEKKYLMELKEKISKLDKIEKLQRDLYLRDLSKGKIQGPMTGYSSIDKPWLKYYSEKAISTEFIPMSAYQLMKCKNIGYEDQYAINYFGNKITYGKLFKNIDLVAKGLLELRIKSGDIVMMSMPNTPEAEYIFYALNKIGAVVNSIDPRTSKDVIKKDIIDSKAKYIFILDIIYSKMKDIAENTTLENVICVSPNYSLPVILKQLMNIKSKKNNDIKDKMTINWDEFIKICKNSNKEVKEYFKQDAPAVIVHTGGSTGIPKGVVLSNEAFNSLAYQLMNTNMGFERQKTFLNILPPFIALGLDNAMHSAACLGLESIMIPSFEPEDFPKLILKHKPNMVMGGPIHFNIMVDSKDMKNKDLSFFEICVSGGDKMPIEQQEKIQKFLKSHNAKANLWLGYGATEVSSGISCVKDDCYRLESVGAPYLNNIVEIYDYDNDEPIQGYGKIGELRINAPTIMLGYFGEMNKETEKVLFKDEFGEKWYRTGDLAHLDNDGMIYIDGRIKRIITRRGFKIYPSYIESLILKHPAVKECAVVGVTDPNEINIPVANIVLNKDDDSKEVRNEVIEFVDDLIKSNLPEYSIMAGYNFLESLPLTSIGKLDFKELEKLGIIDNNEKRLQKKFDIN